MCVLFLQKNWSYPFSKSFEFYPNNLFGKKKAPLYRCFTNTYFFMLSTKWQPACPDLSHAKQMATKTMYPNKLKGNCTLLLLSNFAQAEWLNVDCNKELLSHVYCMHCKHDSLILPENTKPGLFCKNSYLEMNDQCFGILWWTNSLMDVNVILAKGLVKLQQITNVSTFLLQVTSFDELPVLLPWNNSHSFVIKYTFQKIIDIIDTYNRQTEIIPHLFPAGFVVHTSRKGHLDFSPENNLHIFDCRSGIYISYLYMCDGHYDCLNDDSDESNCNCTFMMHKGNKTLQTTRCKYITFINASVKCGPLHFSTGNSCQPFVQIKPQKLQKATAGRSMNYCLSGEPIYAYLWNDLVSDCFDQSEVELKLLLVHGTKFACENPNQFPCKYGHSTCYNSSMTCIFLLDSKNNLYPCRNGDHLQRCKNYQCSSHFKCVESYCIPWSAVCDGKRDCPLGEDELSKNICSNPNYCRMIFKCKVSSIKCIHMTNVCDGMKDCPLIDDEFLCDLQNIKCPKYCNCLTFALICEEKQKELFEQTYPYLSVAI